MTAEATKAITVLEVVPTEGTAVCVNLCGCAECLYCAVLCFAQTALHRTTSHGVSFGDGSDE